MCPSLDNYDFVSILHSSQAVGYHNRRAAPHEPFERLLYQALAFVIQRACCLVQNQDPWIAQQGSRDSDTLSLPNR